MRDTEEILAEYNMWRRGDENFNPSPTEVGIAIDDALIQLAALKEENGRLKARVAELGEALGCILSMDDKINIVDVMDPKARKMVEIARDALSAYRKAEQEQDQ